jgi:hypothetical protein
MRVRVKVIIERVSGDHGAHRARVVAAIRQERLDARATPCMTLTVWRGKVTPAWNYVQTALATPKRQRPLLGHLHQSTNGGLWAASDQSGTKRSHRRSELHPWALPGIVSRLGASERLSRPAPALTCVAPRAASPNIQKPLALRIEVEKPQHLSALRRVQRVVAADQFVVRHAAVCHSYSSPRFDLFPSAERQAWPENQRIEQVAFKSQVIRHGAVVVRARQGRDEIDVAGGPAFQKTASRNLDHHFYLWRLERCVAGGRWTAVRIVHSTSLPHSDKLDERS